jgi:hypothetical protein
VNGFATMSFKGIKMHYNASARHPESRHNIRLINTVLRHGLADVRQLSANADMDVTGSVCTVSYPGDNSMCADWSDEQLPSQEFLLSDRSQYPGVRKNSNNLTFPHYMTSLKSINYLSSLIRRLYKWFRVRRPCFTSHFIHGTCMSANSSCLRRRLRRSVVI